jgi:hypothetical protein
VLVYTNGLIIIASIEANPRRTGGDHYSYKHTSTGGGSAAPRVAKPDGVVDGIFP